MKVLKKLTILKKDDHLKKLLSKWSSLFLKLGQKILFTSLTQKSAYVIITKCVNMGITSFQLGLFR